MKDGANGLELIRQRCDYQDVHYVVHGHDCSVSACCGPAAASDAAAATVSSDRSTSFCLALLVRVVPKAGFNVNVKYSILFRLFYFGEEKKEKIYKVIQSDKFPPEKNVS